MRICLVEGVNVEKATKILQKSDKKEHKNLQVSYSAK